LFRVSFAALGLGPGLGTASLGLGLGTERYGLGLGLVTARQPGLGYWYWQIRPGVKRL